MGRVPNKYALHTDPFVLFLVAHEPCCLYEGASDLVDLDAHIKDATTMIYSFLFATSAKFPIVEISKGNILFFVIGTLTIS